MDQRNFGLHDHASNSASELELFIRAYLAALYRLANALCQHQGSAEDLVATTVEIMASRWQTVEIAPLAFARRTMINLFLNEVRHTSVIREVASDQVPDSSNFAAADLADGAATRVDIARALARLKPELRMVLVLRFLADMSVADVASAMGRPAGTIRRLTHDAIANIKASVLIEGFRDARR